MNEHEARAKAYSIVARFAEVVAQMPELFDLAVSGLDVSEQEIAQVKSEIATTVVEDLRETATYYRYISHRQPRVKRKQEGHNEHI